MLNLFHAPGSCSRAAHIALCEANAPHTVTRVDLAQYEQRSADYLATNPKGRVPALATPRGVLTENIAILVYIAQAFPEARLAPLDDPFDFARMQAFNAYLSSTVHVAHAHRVRGIRWVEEDDAASIAAMRAKTPKTMSECFQLMNDELFEGPWVLGEDYSVADGYLFTLSLWLPAHGLELASFARIAEHNERMLARPAVQAALAVDAEQTP